jgi:hypothetical protein
MPARQLDSLVRIGKLKSELPSKAEFDGLVRSGKARLKDANNTTLHAESRFDLAYNAAHALSLAALRWHGYRSDSRYLVFQCLEHTLDLPAASWRVLDKAHQKRNLAEYEGELDIDAKLLEALIRVTSEIQNLVAALAALPGDKITPPRR